MAFKTREEILALTKRRHIVSNGVRLQSLSEVELSTLKGLWADRYGKSEKVDLVNRRELVAVCAVDEDGNRLFTNEDVEALGAIDGQFLEAVYEDAAKHVGLRKDDSEVDKTEKKSESTAD